MYLANKKFPEWKHRFPKKDVVIKAFAEDQGLIINGDSYIWFCFLVQSGNFPKLNINNQNFNKLHRIIKKTKSGQISKSKSFIKSLRSAYKEKEPGIYKIECLVNGNIYIGSSSSVKARWDWHISDLKNNKHHNYKLQKDFNDFGIQKFTFEKIYSPLENISRDELYNVEQIYIDHYKPEYNIEKIVSKPPPKKSNLLLSGQRKMQTSKLHK